eukprot:s29_g41.t2
MIIDARGTNRLFQEPPGVQLLTSDGFSRVELVVPEGLSPGSQEYEQYLQTKKIYMGLSDVKDCFHRLRQPKWLSEFFCFEGIPAKWVGLEGSTLDGVQLGPDSIVYPAPGSLSMGFTWSLFFAQRINERMMARVSSLQHSLLVNDRSEAIVFEDASTSQKVHHYVYVDNLGILSTDHRTVEVGLKEVEEVFNQEMLILHPGTVHDRSVKALGCDLRGDLLASRVTPERYHKVHQALLAVLNRRKISGRLLEVVVGHATFVALTCRNLLSIFNTTYRYIRSNYDRPAVLWKSVREEIFVFRSLMIYLHADWARPWNTYVSASDASLTGFGVVSSFWKREDVARVGRLQERSRFKRLGSHSAREAALTTAGFVRDQVTNEWVAGWMDDEHYLQHSGWGLNKDFAEVPAHLLQRDLWTPRLWGKWEHEAGILELEARALVKRGKFSCVKGRAAAPKKETSLNAPARKDAEPSRTPLLRVKPMESALVTPHRSGVFNLVDVCLSTKPTPAKKSQDSSSESTSSTQSNRKRKKSLTLEKRKRRRSGALVDGVMENGDLSFLEDKAINASTSRQYQAELDQFLMFAKPRQLDFSRQEDVDFALVKHMNNLYFAGYQSYRADRLMAAFLHRYPQYGRNGSLSLPRSWRAIKGFRKLTPGRSRKALPLAVWAAFACEMRRLSHLRMAIFLLLSVCTYARPSELLRARVFSLVRPAAGVTQTWSLLLSPEEKESRSKTGEFDTSVMLDSPWLVEWIHPILDCLKRSHPESALWDFDYSAYNRIFREVAQTFNLEVTPYQTRHSGPSIDRARNYRSQQEVQKRGQWRAQKSVMRCVLGNMAVALAVGESIFSSQARAGMGGRFKQSRALTEKFPLHFTVISHHVSADTRPPMAMEFCCVAPHPSMVEAPPEIMVPEAPVARSEFDAAIRRLEKRMEQLEMQLRSVPETTVPETTVPETMVLSNSQPHTLKIREAIVGDEGEVSATGEDPELTEQTSDQIKFGESVWSLPLVLDFRRFPLWDSIFAVLLFLVNLGMQAMFSSILLSDDFNDAGVQVEEERENARKWRMSIAHDWRYMDLSETSLVTRVCQSDGALILSTPQAELIGQINSFLGLGPGDFEPGFLQPGIFLCSICILHWGLCVYKEFRSVWLALEAVIMIPRAPRSTFIEDRLASLSTPRLVVVLVSFVLRIAIASIMLVAGINWLGRTTSITELMLNAVALNGIMDVDELLFAGFIPVSVRQSVRRLEPIKMNYSRSRSQCESFGLFLLLGATVLVPYLVYLEPLTAGMVSIKWEMCGGNQTFVVANNPEVQQIIGYRTQEARSDQEPTLSEIAVDRHKFQEGGPAEYIFFSASRTLFSADMDEDMSGASARVPSCIETGTRTNPILFFQAPPVGPGPN